MIVFLKLLQAVILGIVMIVSLLLMIVATAFFLGYLAQLAGLQQLADTMFNVQHAVWKRTRKWFFRFLPEKKAS